MSLSACEPPVAAAQSSSLQSADRAWCLVFLQHALCAADCVLRCLHYVLPCAGELLKLVRDMKRTIAEQRANPATNAAGVVKELENIHDKILAVVPSAADDADVHSPAHAASRQGSSFDNARGGFAGLAAGALGQLGHMREAIAGGLGSARGARPAARVSDSSGAQGAEGLTPTQSGTATLGSSGSEQVEKQ